MAHGGGGRETWGLVRSLIVSKVPEWLRRFGGGYGTDVLDDGAAFRVGGVWVVIASDSFTVNPPVFPGGDIGHLAACGVINDVVMMGADPALALDDVVVEEGVEEEFVGRLLESFISVLVSEGVALVGGDFKVMPRGSVDKIVISATCVGLTADDPIVDRVREGDKVVVTGPIGEHGAAILAAQLGMGDGMEGIKSDSKPLTRCVLPTIKRFRKYIHAARDPTRGGLAATLSEWVEGTDKAVVIRRADIPVRREVREFLDAVGVDPLDMACEGVAAIAVEPDVADDLVKCLKSCGEHRAAVVGEVIKAPDPVLAGRVIGVTEVGGKVVIEPKPISLPRIC